MTATEWARDLIDLVLPAGCVACGCWVPGGSSLVCAGCRMRLSEAPWPRCDRCHHPRGTGRSSSTGCLECASWPPELTAARYAYILEKPADDLVHALKYEGWQELDEFMASAMARLAVPAPPASPLVVPVPTTTERVARRGYNQAELIARRFAELLGSPFHHALERREGDRSQTSLTPAERRENVRGVFRPTRGARAAVRDRHVLLVDDVLTTGATAGEAAGTLASLGVGAVTLVTFARALPTRSDRAR